MSIRLDAGCHASTLWNGAVHVGSTVVKTASDLWNDPNTRTIIIAAVIITVVVLATGGLAAPVVAGMVIGGGFSGAIYGATCGSHCSVMGALAAISTGAAEGAVGGAAGPLGGTIAKSFDLAAAGPVARLATIGMVSGTQGLLDAGAGKSLNSILGDMALSAGTASLGSLVGPEGMDTMAQVKAGFAPGFGSFGRALLGTSDNTYNASAILLGDVSTGLLEGLGHMILGS